MGRGHLTKFDMAKITLNCFKRITGCAAKYQLQNGHSERILNKRQVRIVPSNSKAFGSPQSILASGQSLISGFFPVCRDIFSGDSHGMLLIITVEPDFNSFSLIDPGLTKSEAMGMDCGKYKSIVNQALSQSKLG